MPGCLQIKPSLRLSGFICLHLFLVFYGSAQSAINYSGPVAASAAGDNRAPTYPVDGTVENSLTHQPIARVLVDGTSDRVLTDDEGRFELQLPQGTTMVRLQRPGYGSRNSVVMRVVKVAPDMSPVTLYLAPSASITAHVVLSTGDQPYGMNFSLYQRTVVNGHAQWMDAGGAGADSGGTVRFFSLQTPGRYVICSGYSPEGTGTAFGYPSLCFPGGTDFASATASPLTLKPGQQVEFEADLTRQAFYPVTVSVPGASGGQVPYVQFHAQNGQSLGSGSAIATGFTFHLPNGSYYADADFNAGKGPDSFRYGRVDFTVAGGPVSGLKLALLPVQPLSVEIHRQFTANQGAGVYVFNGPSGDGAGINLNLTSADSSDGGGYSGGLQRDPNAPYGDLFQLQISQPGRYWAHVDAYGPHYVSSITCGGVDLASHPLVVGPGGTSYPIEITLRNDMGYLAATVAPPPAAASTEGNEAGGEGQFFVYAIPLFPTVERIHQWVWQAGQQSFPTYIPPGDYVVVASDHPRDFDLDDPREMARLISQGQKVAVEPGQTATVVLSKLISDVTEAGQ